MERIAATAQGQVSNGAAEVYEEFFVPALFAQWPPYLAQAAAVGPGDRVLDVACGTGIAARYLAAVTGPTGAVAGLDRNEGMLAVARRKAAQVEWRQGRAEALPFAEGTFDAIVCQFGLMFFDDQVQALREMARVVRPGGSIVVATWDTYTNSPGYARLIGLLAELFGEDVADELRQPFALSDTQAVAQLFADAGMHNSAATTHTGRARFPSLEAWISTEIRGWTLAEKLDARAQQQLLAAAAKVMQPYISGQGTVAFPAPAHFVRAAVP